MKNAIRLILGSILMLQVIPVPFLNSLAASTPMVKAEQIGLSHSMDLALYMNQTMQALLPWNWREKSAVIADAVVDASNRYELDPLLLMAVIKHESRFNPDARGRHGEIGLMQIKPSTALWLLQERLVPSTDGGPMPTLETVRELLTEPRKNIFFGAAYLAHLKGTFKNRTSLYLAAYNMGALNVKHRLRDGLRPRIYSDHIRAELEILGKGFKSARAQRFARTIASGDVHGTATRTFGLN